MFASMIFLATVFTDQGPAQASLSSKDSHLGTCSVNRVNMLDHTLFLKNTRLEDPNRIGFDLSIEDEDIVLFERGESDYGKSIRIDYYIDKTSDLDIDTYFAIIDRDYYIYWRETFKYKIYRQGLLKIVGGDPRRGVVLEPLCEGHGGFEIYPEVN